MNITHESDQMSGNGIEETDKTIHLDESEEIDNSDYFISDEDSVYIGMDYSKHIGAYRITPVEDKVNTIDFCYHKKPNWFHRMCCKFFLGWTWIDFD